MRHVAAAIVAIALLGTSIWWAGWFGLLMGIFFVLAVSVLFLNNTDILTLPPAAKRLLWIVVIVTAMAVVVVGGHNRFVAAAAEKAAAPPPLPPIEKRHTRHEVVAGQVPQLEPGNNHLSMLPGGDTGCMTAAAGWVLLERQNSKYDDPPPSRHRGGQRSNSGDTRRCESAGSRQLVVHGYTSGRSTGPSPEICEESGGAVDGLGPGQEEARAIQIWVDCHRNGGVRTYGDSDYIPTSIRLVNATGEAVQPVVIMTHLSP